MNIGCHNISDTMLKFILLLGAVAIASSTAYAARDNLLRVPLTSQVDESTNPNFCQGCRSFVSLMTRFNSSSERENSKKIVQNFCETVYPPSTDFQQGPCPIFVEGTFFVIDRIDPVTHCDKIGACGPDASTPYELAKAEDNSIPKLSDGRICEICEQTIMQLQAQLENPKFVDVIKRQATSFCDYLAIINQDKECRQMLEGYIDDAIDFIRQVKPLKACQSISVCAAGRELSSKRPISVPSLASYHGFGIETKVMIGDQVVKDLSAPKRIESGHSPNCMFCKAFVKEMFKFLRENRTEDNIRLGLDKVCKLVYVKNTQKLEQCESLVATYTKELVQMLVDETDPELICIMLEQCTYQSSISTQFTKKNAQIEEEQQPIDLNQFISILDPSVPLGSLSTCVECKLFIQYLRNTIDNPNSVAHVKNWLLSNLCNNLDETKAKDACIKMVNNYASTFFQILATDMDPKKACIELKACNQRVRLHTLNLLNNRPMIAHYIKPQTVTVKAPLCDQCVQIVAQIDDYLASHPIDHDVSVLVDEVCNKLPNETVVKECTYVVQMFGQDIAQAISTMDSPQQLCTKISLC